MSKSLNSKVINITDGLTGALIPAQLMTCGQCNGELWIIFEIDGQTHPHVQCVHCNTSYCPRGQCKGTN